MDRLRNLEIFVAVAEQGSLVGAARQLHLSPPAVTRALAALEEHLGARLFTRSTRSLTLTEAGAQLRLRAQEILALTLEAEREAAGEGLSPRGQLTVTASVIFGRSHVAPVLLEFLRQHPAVSGSLMLLDRVVNLVEESVDVAFRIGELPDSSLLSRKVGQVQRVLVASPLYLARHGLPQHPRDLHQHQILSLSGLMPGGEWRYQEGDNARRITLKPHLEVNDAATTLAAALAGEGITLTLNTLAQAHLRSGALQGVLEPWWPAPVPVHALTAESRLRSARVRSFLDFAVPRLSLALESEGCP